MCVMRIINWIARSYTKHTSVNLSYVAVQLYHCKQCWHFQNTHKYTHIFFSSPFYFQIFPMIWCHRHPRCMSMKSMWCERKYRRIIWYRIKVRMQAQNLEILFMADRHGGFRLFNAERRKHLLLFVCIRIRNLKIKLKIKCKEWNCISPACQLLLHTEMVDVVQTVLNKSEVKYN